MTTSDPQETLRQALRSMIVGWRALADRWLRGIGENQNSRLYRECASELEGALENAALAALPSGSTPEQKVWQAHYYGDDPLSVGVVDGRLLIAIGVQTLAHAVTHADWANLWRDDDLDGAGGDYRRDFVILDAEAFARDVAHAMLDEREDGSTPLSDFIDKSSLAAVEGGSEATDDAEDGGIPYGQTDPRETWSVAPPASLPTGDRLEPIASHVTDRLEPLIRYLDSQFGLALRPEHGRAIRDILQAGASLPTGETTPTATWMLADKIAGELFGDQPERIMDASEIIERELLLASTPAEPSPAPCMWREVKLGVIEFHPQAALRERFYHVVDDLRAAGCIVDLWLMDIATVLKEFGYEMTVKAPLVLPPAQEK